MASLALRSVFIAALVTPALSRAAEAGGQATVVVIATKGKGGPALAPQVKTLVEKPLGKQFKVLPLPAYQKAAKKAGVKPKDALTPASAVSVGGGAGATHVLFVEGQVEKEKVGKKTKQTFFAGVILVDVATGDQILKTRYELKGKKIDAKVAATMVTEIGGALTKPAAAPPPAPEAEATPEPPVAPPPPPEGTPVADAGALPPPDAPPPPPEGATLAAAPTEVPAEPAPSTPPPAAETPATESAPVLAALSQPMSGEPPAITVSDTATRGKRWRPALHVGIGGIGLQRKAAIKAEGAKPPGYEGPLPGAFMQLSFFPLAIGGNGGMHEGIGVFAEGHFMRVETVVDDVTKQTVSSDVVGMNGGLAFRLVFWDSDVAPDFTLKVGYGSFAFPLKAGAFPTTRYGNLTAGGAFTIPFVKQFALVLGGAFEQRLAAGLKKDTELGTVSSQMGFRADGGLRLYIDPVEVMVFGRFEQLTSKFKGGTTLASQTQYSDVTLEDRYFGGWATAGIAF
ncbi:MAG: hypothetical protein HY903_04870 [Deltaproteobacteria bacterium]|nr:hypothetical protein [Deltaproteobacteria bacterium]